MTSRHLYSVARDGQRFPAAKRAAAPPSPTATHINLVLNWFEELKAKVPIVVVDQTIELG